MLSLSPNYAYSSISFQSKHSSKTQNKPNNNQNNNKPHLPKSGVSKSVAGVLAASAFLVGVETGRVAPEPFEANATKSHIELYAPMPSETPEPSMSFTPLPGSTSAPAPAPASAAAPDNLNKETDGIPVSDEKKYYEKKCTLTMPNGKQYKMCEEFEVREVAHKVREELYDINTGDLVQVGKYKDYVYVPTNVKFTDANGGFIESREFKNFNKTNCCPESGIIITNRGNLKRNVTYKMEDSSTKSSQNKKTEPKPNNTNNNDDDVYYDILNMIFGS